MLNMELSTIKKVESEVKLDKGCISLSQGALKVGGIPMEIKNHLQSVLNTDRADYYQGAWGILPLREKIAQHLSRVNHVSLSYKNVLVTHGCTGAISTLLLTLLESGDEVLLPEPTYPAYKNVVSVARGNPVFVSCDDSFKLDIDKIEAARTEKTKILLFSNPVNPTGVVIPKQTIEALVRWCEKYEIYLIVDESYDDYIFEGQFDSATAFVTKSKHVIRAGSYSKSLSMSGWRVGFMIVPDHLSIQMGVTQDALLNCPNVIAQHAVLHALDHPEYSEKFHDIVKKNRDDVCDMLQLLIDPGIISYRKPDAGFYLFLKTQEKDSYNLCFDILRRAKVGLVPGRAFGLSGAPFIRLCYARIPEVLHEGVDRLLSYFSVHSIK